MGGSGEFASDEDGFTQTFGVSIKRSKRAAQHDIPALSSFWCLASENCSIHVCDKCNYRPGL